MAADHIVGGGVVLAAASAGLVTITKTDPLHVPLEQLALVTLFAAIGAVARAFMDGAAARQKAAQDGVERGKRPEVDYLTLGYALLGAPFVGDLAWTIVQYVGFIPDSAAVCVVMGTGYLGRDAINAVISRFQRSIVGKIGGDK